MVLHTPAPTSAKLRNGETVYVNDHVYVSPPWSDRDSTPYMVCRIIEFVPALGTPKKGGSSHRAGNELQARLSLYYRPSDISGRNVSDFRLLLAAIHTDVQPLSNVRGKCYVRHKDRIEDLIKWKKLPDHFYFIKYFDPYIKREFEVLRTENVNNIPQNIKDVLVDRYEYLLTEREMVADLTDNFRTCCVCDTWASSQESVRCEACKNNYHMGCLNPPMTAKPAKGYSWVCLPCTVQRHKDVQDKKFLYQPNGSAPKTGKANGKAKEKAAALNPNRPDKTHRGWPWRYFGLYTNAHDTLDPDDPIFPKAATRIGTKYQADVASWEEQQAAEERHRLGESESGPSRHIAVERGHDPGEKHHDSTIDIWSLPSDDLASYMDEVAQLSLPVPPHDVERLDRAIKAYTTLGRTAAVSYMRGSRHADFNPVVFNEYDTATFEDELERQGGLDTHETGRLLEKRPAQVLRFSYIWKNKQLKAENEAIRQHRKVNTAHARQNKTLGAPSLGRIRTRHGSEDSDGESSLYGDEIKDTKKAQCAACSTRISTVWWRAPRTIPGDAMCENCGSNYRKYGVISFTKAEDSKKPPEKGEPKAKKQKLGDTSGTATPAPPPPPKLPPCCFCRKMDPKASMARCKTCTFSVHSSCYGIAPEEFGPKWECELCANEHSEEAHLHPRCVLCPQDTSALSIKAKKRPPADFDVLSCLKPTESRQWAHILCASWHPEVQFTNTSTYKAIENISLLPAEKWQGTCSLCGQQDGAVTNCTDCALLFHPSCAWTVGHRFGFEFVLAKSGRREAVTITKFREEIGVMMPGIWCKGHDLEGRVIYDMNDVDPELNESALQIYTASYKALPQDESFALLRKATRLDKHILQPQAKPEAQPKSCMRCEVNVSPRWHLASKESVDSIKQEYAERLLGKSPDRFQHLCHQCWFAEAPSPA